MTTHADPRAEIALLIRQRDRAIIQRDEARRALDRMIARVTPPPPVEHSAFKSVVIDDRAVTEALAGLVGATP